MVKLNLLPPEKRERKQISKENALAIILAIITGIIMLSFAGYLWLIKTDTESQISNIKNDIASQEKTNAQYKEIKDTIVKFNANMAILNKLSKTRIPWSSILDDIRNRIPGDAVISELTTELQTQNTKSNQNPPITVTIKGTVGSVYPAAKFQESLSSSPYYDYVDFESATVGTGSKQGYEFILHLRIKKQ